jgi:hypothetical protein
MSDQTTTTEAVGESPFVTPKVAKARTRRGGIGHNSGTTSEALRENISSETFSELIGSVRTHVLEYDKAFTAKVVVAEQKSGDLACSLYNLCHVLDAAGADLLFREQHDISVHGNSRMRFQPIVAYYFRSLHRPYVKSLVSKLGTIITRGIEQGVSPDDFSARVRAVGVENLYIQFKPEPDKANWAETEKLAESILPVRGDAPLFTDIMVPDDRGRRLVVIECEGAGAFRVLAILPHSPKDVIQLMAAIAKKQRAQTE